MLSSNLIRLSGLAAVLGGVLFLVVELLSFATETAHLTENLSEWATTTPWLFTWSLFLLGGVLLQIGLVGLYVRQAEAAGVNGLVGFVVAFLGTALAVGAIWSQLFIVPDLGIEFPTAQPAGVPRVPDQLVGALWFYPSFLIFFPLGWYVFGVTAWRARVYSRAAAMVLMVGALLAVIPVPLFGIVLDVTVAWLGLILFTGRGETALQPSRVN